MKKNMVVVGLLIVAVVAVVGIRNARNANAAGDAPGCADGVCTLTIPQKMMAPAGSEPAAAPAARPLPKLLDLGAGKCIPCKTMAPILDEMKGTFAGRLDVQFIDVWENEDAAKQYGIRMIPTQIFFDANDKELFRHEGFFSREDILAKWKELGFGFGAKE